MFKSWQSMPPDHTDMDKFRAYVFALHTKLTEAGTNVVHLSTIPGQFNFDTEVLGVKTATYSTMTKPLIYKFTGENGHSAYIKISFGRGGITTATAYNLIVSRVGVWHTEEECIAEFPSQNYIMSRSMYYDTDTPVVQSLLESVIFFKNNTLVIMCSVGYIGDGYKFTHAPVFLMLKVHTEGFCRVTTGPYTLTHKPTSGNSNISSGYYGVSVVSSSRTNSNTVSYTFNTTNYVLNDIVSFIPVNHRYVFGGFDSFDGVYIYNRTYSTDEGVRTVDGRSLWLAGSRLEQLNVNSGNTTFALITE